MTIRRIIVRTHIPQLAAGIRAFMGKMKLGGLRKFLIAVVGGSVVLLGIAMIVLPGPAILVIPLGLTILATEFMWARRWLNRARALLPGVKKPPPPAPPAHPRSEPLPLRESDEN